MKLSEKELADLMEVRSINPTPEEIQAAIEETGNLLQQEDRYAYLLDENSVVHAVSEGFIRLLNIDKTSLPDMLGRPILELAFEPKFGIFKYLDWKKCIPAAAVEIVRLSRAPKAITAFLENSFKRLPHYPELMKESESVPYEDTVSARTRKIYFNINGRKMVFHYAKENLRINFRFGIVEYYNIDDHND